MPDFSVQRDTTDITAGNTQATITAGVDYTAPSAITAAFIRLTNTRLSGAGNTSGGGTQNVDDWTVRIDNPENLLTSITFTRIGSTGSSRVAWEIIEYTGSASGANEFIVRDQEEVATTGTTATVDGTTVTTISDINAAALIITSQAGSDTGAGNFDQNAFTSELVLSGSDYIPRFTRGSSVAAVSYVSYAVVEFTGSNWSDVQRVTQGDVSNIWTTTPDNNHIMVDLTSAVTNPHRTFIHGQYTHSSSGAIDNAGDNMLLRGTSNTAHVMHRDASSTRNHVMWIMENTQTGGTKEMRVWHAHFYVGTGTAPRTETLYMPTVSATAETSVFGESASADGSGTALPRGSWNIAVASTTTSTAWEADGGQEGQVSWDIIEWPTV